MLGILKGALESLRQIRNEDFFLSHLDRDKVPAHVAVIMDGNGRWAAQRALPRIAGHRAGAKAVREIVNTAPEIGVKYLTLYTFSLENWKRPSEEVNSLMALIGEKLNEELPELHQKGVRIRVIGRLKEMPEFLQRSFEEAVKLTADNKLLTLTVALNYGSRAEIADAVKKIAQKAWEKKLDPGSITEEMVSGFLYASDIPDPELLIRTSGELRLSNFLLWQSAYTELWVTKANWPDFKRRDFLQAIYDFQQRRRRYGGLEDI